MKDKMDRYEAFGLAACRARIAELEASLSELSVATNLLRRLRTVEMSILERQKFRHEVDLFLERSTPEQGIQEGLLVHQDDDSQSSGGADK